MNQTILTLTTSLQSEEKIQSQKNAHYHELEHVSSQTQIRLNETTRALDAMQGQYAGALKSSHEFETQLETQRHGRTELEEMLEDRDRLIEHATATNQSLKRCHEEQIGQLEKKQSTLEHQRVVLESQLQLSQERCGHLEKESNNCPAGTPELLNQKEQVT